MTDEKLTNEAGTVEDTTQDYIDAIKTLKQNSVDRSKYDELRAENKRLLQAVVNGQPGEEQVEEKPVDLNELRRALTKEQTNLEYITNALKLREAVINQGGEDPFVPVGSKYTPTAADYERANRVATVLQEMVDEADGDPQVFLNEYQRRVKK